MTVSVVADDAGKQLFAAARAAQELSWISRLTVLDCQPLSRSWRRFVGLAGDDMQKLSPYRGDK